ncbi:hypothetical protein P4O66_019674 [Electrophorus voltai]|uniref:DUF4939 domain-containing protein n=1 Tax=Electrophorus voltai TaxID=2609070 RepID=A0AAD9E804_9TELE|nr:hypothetical protein P4O66_019674 [Electrophorus voltai]
MYCSRWPVSGHSVPWPCRLALVSEPWPDRLCHVPPAAPSLETAGAAAATEPCQILPCSHSEPLFPAPECYAGEVEGCRGFLLQCSLAFEQQPSRFPKERAKVVYIISLLTGQALTWATLVWEHQTDVCSTAAEFTAALKQTFNHPVTGGRRFPVFLTCNRGEERWLIVSEFHTVVAESGWNPTVLMAAFHQGLSEDLKDELVHRDTLDDLIDLVLRIDSRVQQRHRTQGPEISQGSLRDLCILALFMCMTSRWSLDPSQCSSDTPAFPEVNVMLGCGNGGVCTAEAYFISGQLVLSSRKKTMSIRGERTSDGLNQSFPSSGVVPLHHNGLENV